MPDGQPLSIPVGFERTSYASDPRLPPTIMTINEGPVASKLPYATILQSVSVILEVGHRPESNVPISADSACSPVARLPWFDELVDYLKTHEHDLWGWFSTRVDRQQQAEAIRLDLLRTTYRIDRESQADLYRTADRAASKLGIDVPLTIYQAQQELELNASLKFVPDEVHLVLHGPLLETLDDSEWQALVGHELSHYLLWTTWESEILIAHEILLAMLNDPRGDEVHLETYRRLQLFTEVFCDRGSYLVCDDLETAVSSLVKMHTGLKKVDAGGYLKQAEEAIVTNRGGVSGVFVTEECSHPEAFLRVRALQLWVAAVSGENGSDVVVTEPMIRRMFEGPLSLERIDLPAQRHLTALTRRLITELIQPDWMRTELVMSHARLFFPDIGPPVDATSGKESPENAAQRKTAAIVPESDDTISKYLCSVLLDFATVDRDIQEAALAWAIQKADQWNIAESFAEAATRKLKLRKKQFQQIREEKGSLIRQAESSRSGS